MSQYAIKYVDHTYRDYSRYVDEGRELPRHKKSANNYPARLHRILSDPSTSHAITWMPHGRSFKILNKKLLVSDVLPNFFSCKKYESFSRQLNGWGFKRLHQAGPDFGSYYHPCFLKGLPELTCLIRRLPTDLGKSIPCPEREPNLFLISDEYPVPPKSTQDVKATKPNAESSVSLSKPSSGSFASNQSILSSSAAMQSSQGNGRFAQASGYSNVKSQQLSYSDSANHTSVNYDGYWNSDGNYERQSQSDPGRQNYSAAVPPQLYEPNPSFPNNLPPRYNTHYQDTHQPAYNQTDLARTFTGAVNSSLSTGYAACAPCAGNNGHVYESSGQENVFDPFEPISMPYPLIQDNFWTDPLESLAKKQD